MQPEAKACPVCQQPAHVLGGRGDATEYECRRCRLFSISRTALINYRDGIPDAHLVSAWIFEQQNRGEGPPLITTDRIDAILKLPRLSVPEKQLRLLRHIESVIDDPGLPVWVDLENDTAAAHARSSRELKYLVRELRKRGFVSEEQMGNLTGYSLTTVGWQYLEEQRKPAKHQRAFVAMSFDPKMKDLWTHAIQPGTRAAGFESHRVDQDRHVERIDARIIAGIRDSSFLIADVTMHKQGVYYEAGFAQGLGLPVIWMVRKDHLKKVHFDTRQFAHIVWTEFDDARDQLTNTILAVMGRGPLPDTGT